MKKLLAKIKKLGVSIYKLIYKLFYEIIRYVVLVFRQMKKVRWPSKKLVFESTSIVLTFIVFLGAYFTFADLIIIQLLGLINY